MEFRGMVLYMNRNIRKMIGYFYISIIIEDKKGRVYNKEKNILFN